MTTSLHDQFHSSTNTNHVYNLLNNMIMSKTNKSIINDDYYSNFFQNSLKEIFIKSSNCSLEDLNREVLHYNLNHFISMFKNKEITISNKEITEPNNEINVQPQSKSEPESEPFVETDVMDNFNKILEMRNMPDSTNKQLNTSSQNMKKVDKKVIITNLNINNCLEHMVEYYDTKNLKFEDIDNIWKLMILDKYSFIQISDIDVRREIINELKIINEKDDKDNIIETVEPVKTKVITEVENRD